MDGQSRKEHIIERIRYLKERTGAFFLVHYYQRREVQDLADCIGDSLGLSQEAARRRPGLILFCGVHFMAETASILCPESKVLVPDLRAGCPMADMVDAIRLAQFKERHPGVPVVCYVNSTAEVKALSDYCCTSANAVKVLENVPGGEAVFVPDRHLGDFAGKRSGKTVHCYPGFCPTHHRLTAAHIEAMKKLHPHALVIAHPECSSEVLALCDYVGGTGGMLRYATDSSASTFIVGTEEGLLHELRRRNPGKEFILASEDLVCPNMKLNTVQKILHTLEMLTNEVRVPDDLRERAELPIRRMMELV
jgi:quinolinate synthase